MLSYSAYRAVARGWSGRGATLDPPGAMPPPGPCDGRSYGTALPRLRTHPPAAGLLLPRHRALFAAAVDARYTGWRARHRRRLLRVVPRWPRRSAVAEPAGGPA